VAVAILAPASRREYRNPEAGDDFQEIDHVESRAPLALAEENVRPLSRATPV
jgi:hypothetical protein